MRVTRAFVASCGAGMSLVAAAVSLLFVLSTVVAVRGWPGIDPEDDVPRLVLSDRISTPSGGDGGAVTTPTAAAADAGDGAGAIVLGAPGAGATAGRTTAGGPPARRTPGGSPRNGQGGSANRGPATSAPSSSAPAAPGPASGPAPIESSPTAPAADAVRDTGDALAPATDPVSPGTAQSTTDDVADAIEGGGRVAEQVLPQAAPVVERTAEAVGTTAQPVADAVGALTGD